MLKGHGKAVTALALDPAGARLLTGSFDYAVKFWDFPAMDRSFRSFRSIEPCETSLIHTLQFSATGDRFLCATQSKKALIFDRDGKKLTEFAEGYQYLADMAQTKGHISNITSALWHPTDPRTIVTASQDSTVRFWDVEAPGKQKQLAKVKNASNVPRLSVSALAMDPAAKYFAVGANDGSLQVFAGKGPFLRPSHLLRGAHRDKTEISSVAFAKDATMLVSRSCDDSMKVWDLRKFTSPMATFADLPCHYPEADIIFSPTEELLCTGTSAVTQGTAGTVVFVDFATLAIVKRLTVSQGSVVSLLWHSKINQLIAGSSDGNVHVLFEPGLSEKGALYAVSKLPRAKGSLDWEPSDLDRPILNPHALPEFKDLPSTKRQREKASKDPLLSRRPEQPQVGHGSKGRLGTSLAADMMKKFIHIDKDVHETRRDPREALLQYADDADKNPMFFKVYKENPTPLNYELSAQLQREAEENAGADEEARQRGWGFTKPGK